MSSSDPYGRVNGISRLGSRHFLAVTSNVNARGYGDYVALFAIFVGAILLRFFHISYMSVWNDEAFSSFYYKYGIKFLWTEGLSKESSPPLYYMMVGAWIQFFGDSETALRSLSAVSSTLAVILVYVLGRTLLDKKKALVAAMLFAVSATQIYYAQEARPYALLLLPVATTLLACIGYLRSAYAPFTLIFYVIFGTICIYAHATMTFFIAACGVGVLHGIWWTNGPSWKRSALWWIGANLCIAALAVPELVGMVHHVGTGILAWIPPVSLHTIGAVMSNTLAGTLTPGYFPGGILAVALAGIVVFGVWRCPLSRPATTILLAVPLLYATFVMLTSFVSQPIFLSRIFCWIGIPLCLLEAHALSVRGWWRPIVIATVVGSTVVGLLYQLDASPDTKQPWRQVVASLRLKLMQADLVVLGPETDPAPLLYYAPSLSRVVVWENKPIPAAQVGVMPALFGINGIPGDEIIRRIGDGERVIFIAGPTDRGVTSQLLSSTGAPSFRIDRRCIGADGNPTRYPCGIVAIGW
jgi:4-amino-4-deoxy-L-arabinose transferase-like glycosyltransferase